MKKQVSNYQKLITVCLLILLNNNLTSSSATSKNRKLRRPLVVNSSDDDNIDNSRRTKNILKKGDKEKNKGITPPPGAACRGSRCVSLPKSEFLYGEDIPVSFYGADKTGMRLVILSRDEHYTVDNILLTLRTCGTQSCKDRVIDGTVVFGEGGEEEGINGSSFPLPTGRYDLVLIRGKNEASIRLPFEVYGNCRARFRGRCSSFYNDLYRCPDNLEPPFTTGHGDLCEASTSNNIAPCCLPDERDVPNEENAPEDWCEEWANLQFHRDNTWIDLVNDELPCPCNERDAADPNSNLYVTFGDEYLDLVSKFHPGANVCYRGNLGKHGQQCCYGGATYDCDGSNSCQLLTFGLGAGTLDKSNTATVSGILDHQSLDVVPYNICMAQGKHHLYDRYRPISNTNNCSPYGGKQFESCFGDDRRWCITIEKLAFDNEESIVVPYKQFTFPAGQGKRIVIVERNNEPSEANFLFSRDVEREFDASTRTGVATFSLSNGEYDIYMISPENSLLAGPISITVDGETPPPTEIPSPTASPATSPELTSVPTFPAVPTQPTVVTTPSSQPQSTGGGSWSGVFGDPHLSTFDRLRFDCQAAGEFVMVTSLDNPSFMIQERFTALESDVCSQGSISTGIAIAEEGLPTVQISLPQGDSTGSELVGSCPMDLFVDGALTTVSGGTGRDDILVSVSSSVVSIRYPLTNFQVRLTVRNSGNFGCHLLVQVFKPFSYRSNERIVGLLGTPNGNRLDDWVKFDGTTLSPPQTQADSIFAASYNYCVENWCVDDKVDSIFSYRDDESFNSISGCHIDYANEIQSLLENAPNTLIELCNDDLSCVVDGVCGSFDDARNAVMDAETVLTEQEDADPLPSSVPSIWSTNSATSVSPTYEPTKTNSVNPSMVPTAQPVSVSPSTAPALIKSHVPSTYPSITPTIQTFTDVSSNPPSSNYSDRPSFLPSFIPTKGKGKGKGMGMRKLRKKEV